MLAGLLPEGMMFPFDFGFIPSTLGEDGDPLDILALMDASAHAGCLIEARIIASSRRSRPRTARPRRATG
jgi:inorganic pyrophosphatase